MSDILESQLDTLLNQCLDPAQSNEALRWLFSQATSAALKTRHVSFDKFIKMGNFDYTDILNEIVPEDWNDNTNRQNNTDRVQTESITLRKAKNIDGITDLNYNQDVRTTKAGLDHYPKTLQFLNNFALKQGAGKLERAMIVNLKPRSEISLHFDSGLYYLFRDRYHFILKSNGSVMQVHDEQSTWNEGEVWWFQNKLMHQAYNNSDEDRIHIIFDVLPYNNIGMVTDVRRKTYGNFGVKQDIIENY